MRASRLALLVAIFATSTLGLLKGDVPGVLTGTWQPVTPMTSPRGGAATALLDGGSVVVTGGSDASGSLASVEVFELQSAEGPCWDCFYSGRAVFNHDLTAAQERWPTFAPVAVAAGFLGSDAIPMRLRGNIIGALNLFRT